MIRSNKKKLNKFFNLYLIFLLFINFNIANAKTKELKIGYFLDWPAPIQRDFIDKILERKLNIKVSWKSFISGHKMIGAMINGNIDIAYSLGVIPFVQAITSKVPITTVAIATSYIDTNNCIVHKKIKINKNNPKDFEGKKIGVNFEDMSYFNLLKQLKYLNVDIKKVKIVNFSRYDMLSILTNKFLNREIDIACVWGEALARIEDEGKVLFSSDELHKIGILSFDIIAVENKFMKKNEDIIIEFLQTVENENVNFKKTKNFEILAMANSKGLSGAMSINDIKDMFKKIKFPSKKQQMNIWFNGTVSKYFKDVAIYLSKVDYVNWLVYDLKVLPDYSNFVTTKYLEKIN